MHTQRDLIIQLQLVENYSSACHSRRHRQELTDRGCGKRFGSSGLAREGKWRLSRLVQIRPRNPSQGMQPLLAAEISDARSRSNPFQSTGLFRDLCASRITQGATKTFEGP